MRDVDVGRRIVVALHADAVLILLTRRIGEVKHLADRAANDVLREFRFVFSPFRFHVARLGILRLHDEADGGPEVLNHGPEFFRLGIDAQPAVRAFLHHLDGHSGGHDFAANGCVALSGRSLLTRRFGVGAHDGRARRNGESVVVADRREIGRDFQIGAGVRRFVLHLLVGEVDAENGAAGDRGRGGGKHSETKRKLGH